ncbi:MAG: endolytic transglycosylase MltG [Anaerolineae bacterium]|nr:endolytic transglycosylase MltG [Anaerolineae bacterium]
MATKGRRVAALLLGISIIAWIVVLGVVLWEASRNAEVGVLPTAPPTVVTQIALVATATTAPTITASIEPTDLPTTAPSSTVTNTAIPGATPSSTLPSAITATPLILPTAEAIAIQPSATIAPVTDVPITESAAAADTVDTANTAASANGCTPPDGWIAYQVEEGDTLFGFQLGSDNTLDVAAIMAANCLTSKLLSIGQVLFLPPGVAEKSPKADGGSLSLPAGASRVANCPCNIQVRQGWRLEQIAVQIDQTAVSFSGRDFLAVVAASAPIPAEFGFLASRPGGARLEGFMFPGVYTLNNDTTAFSFRDMMLSAFAANVTPDIQAAINANGLSLWEGVNMASIIQRESGDAETQKIIASIFYNRRAREMGLGSFTTLQYALGGSGSWWPRITKANINTDTPYATHRYKGLPPTPISNPGLSAIIAVAYPAQTDYLYMNAKCDGSGNYYARTYEEFQAGLNCQ